MSPISPASSASVPAIPTSASIRAIADARPTSPSPHRDAAQSSLGDLMDLIGGGAGKVYGETLQNGVRLIVAERPGAHSVKVQLGIGAGSMQDPNGKLGLAHLLEHLAFEGSPTRSAPQQQKTRREMGEMWNAYTDRDSIVYYGIAPNSDAKRAASLITDMFQNPNTSKQRLEQERAAVTNEMSFHGGSLTDEGWNIAERLVFGTRPETNNVIGTKQSVDAITAKDLKAYHQAYFTGRNTVALIEGDPEHLPLDTIRKQLSKLAPGARVDNDSRSPQHVPGQALQIVNNPSTHTVELDVIIPVPTQQLIGMKTPPRLITTALNAAFDDRLRRSQGLTYGVNAKIEPGDESSNPGTMLLHVNTRVASDKAHDVLSGIISTIKDASNGLGDKTFERNKATFRARIKTAEAEKIGVSDRAEMAFQGALQLPGIDIPPGIASSMPQRQLNQLRTVNAEDFARDAGTLLNLDHVKIMATGPIGDNGAGLRAALKAGGLDTTGLAMNPVELASYRGSGAAIPPGTEPHTH